MSTYSAYDPETITLATLDSIPEELVPLQKALKKFLKQNSQHWSMSSLANFLGSDVHVLKKFIGHVKVQDEKAHTILVLHPISEAHL